jgi:hypothetical protein
MNEHYLIACAGRLIAQASTLGDAYSLLNAVGGDDADLTLWSVTPSQTKLAGVRFANGDYVYLAGNRPTEALRLAVRLGQLGRVGVDRN